MTQLGEVQYLDGKPITDAGNRHTRRSFLVTSAAAGTLGLLRFGSSSYAEPPASLSFPRPRPLRLETPQTRPFRVNVPEAELVDLRRRIAATRWPCI